MAIVMHLAGSYTHKLRACRAIIKYLRTGGALLFRISLGCKNVCLGHSRRDCVNSLRAHNLRHRTKLFRFDCLFGRRVYYCGIRPRDLFTVSYNSLFYKVRIPRDLKPIMASATIKPIIYSTGRFEKNTD